jgi:hypothetical protein
MGCENGVEIYDRHGRSYDWPRKPMLHSLVENESISTEYYLICRVLGSKLHRYY